MIFYFDIHSNIIVNLLLIVVSQLELKVVLEFTIVIPSESFTKTVNKDS